MAPRPAARAGGGRPRPGAGRRLLLQAPRRGGRSRGRRHGGRRALGHRGAPPAGRQRAPGFRAPGALQRQPEVAPDRSPGARPRPGAGVRARVGALLSGARGGGLPPGARRVEPARGRRRRALRGPEPGLRDPLQPQQRRQLRRGAGARQLGALARGARHGRARGPPAARLCRRPAARPGLLVPHPGRDPPGGARRRAGSLDATPGAAAARGARRRRGARLRSGVAVESRERLGVLPLPASGEGAARRVRRSRDRRGHLRRRRQAVAAADRSRAGAARLRHGLFAGARPCASSARVARGGGRRVRAGARRASRGARALLAARDASGLCRDEPRDRRRRAAARAGQPALRPVPHVGGAGAAGGRCPGAVDGRRREAAQ